MKLSIVILILVFACSCERRADDKWPSSPHFYSKKSPLHNVGHLSGSIPGDLDACFPALRNEVSPELVSEIENLGGEDEMSRYHLNLGLWIRNNWVHPRGSPLALHFNDIGIYHPDDMSGIILTSFWRHLHAQPLRVKEQVKYYQEYWAHTEKMAAREETRTGQAAEKIAALMLDLKLSGDGAATATLPERNALYGLQVRYAESFDGGVLVGVRTLFRDGSFSTQPFYLDLRSQKLHPVEVKGLSNVTSVVVVRGVAYFSGTRAGVEVVSARSGVKTHTIDTPPGTGWLRLGYNQTRDSLIALRAHGVFELNGTWSQIYSSKGELPLTAVPPWLIADRLYFRDEGKGENKKMLSWVVLSEGAKRSYLHKDTGLVGPRGPRWENVSSFSSRGDTLWAAAGTALLRWSKAEGYRIALINGSTTFDGNILGSLYDEKLADRTPVQGIEIADDDSVNLIGPHGLYRLKGNTLKVRVRFKNTNQKAMHFNLTPSTLLTVGENAYFVGSTFDGIYLLTKDPGGAWRFKTLDEQRGSLIVW